MLSDLGSGAHGSVIKARDDALDRIVAVKRLRIPTDDCARAIQEAKSLARLSHPNIVSIYGLFENGGFPHLVLEYAEGQPLRRTLEQGPLSLGQFEKLAIGLISALAYSHGEGVLHGDVSPANIIVSDDGEAKLVDFGLSKLNGREGAFETMNADDGIAEPLEGTLPYIAPEIVMGSSHSAKAEVFALGCTFYEALTGMRAFAQASNAGTLNAILNKNPEPLDVVRPGIPEWLAHLIEHMLEKDPNLRLGSMQEVCEFFCRAQRQSDQPRNAEVTNSTTVKRWLAQPILRIGAPLGLTLAALTAASNWSPQADYSEMTVSERMELGLTYIHNFASSDAVDSAKQVYSSILAQNPDHAGAAAGMALILLREYTSSESDPAILARATSLANSAMERDPQLALAIIASGWAAEFNGDIPEALELYARADVLDRENILTLEGRARLLKKLGDFAAAESQLRRALELSPKSANILNDLGDILMRSALYTDAELVFRRAIDAAPDNPFGYANAAQSLHMQGRTDEAIAVAQDGLEVVSDTSLYNNLGTYLYFLGRYEEAARAFERVLELDGNSHSYLYWANLGDAYRQIPSEQARARIAYRRAIQIINSATIRQEEALRIRSRLALYAAKSGDVALAQVTLERIEDALSGRPAETYRAAMTWEILGQRGRAIEALKDALELGYPFEEVANEPEFAELRQDRQFQLSVMGGMRNE